MALVPEETVYEVSELTRELKSLIESRFFSVAVKGELSSLSRPSSGHQYFTLKDPYSQLSCAFFKPRANRCPFELEEGMEVILQGKVSLYEPRGSYQLIVHSVEPIGEGALQLAYEQLKSKLEAQGLFEQKHKRALPFLPRRIGVVTSPTGAAVQDVLQILNRRAPNVGVLIAPSLVQGEQAPTQLKAGIEALAVRDQVDLIILTRGGGSLEDLWAFNDESLAQVIFRCPVPIISAVGHETDFTIADFVADLRAPTPSAAAELAVPRLEDLQTQIRQLGNQLGKSLNSHLGHLSEQISFLSRRLRSPEAVILSQMQRKDELDLRLAHAIRLYLSSLDRRLGMASKQQGGVHLRERISHRFDNVTEIKKRLELSMTPLLRFRGQKVTNLVQRLESASPLSAFKRGYGVVKNFKGEVTSSVAKVEVGSALEIELSDGIIRATVREVLPKSPIA